MSKKTKIIVSIVAGLIIIGAIAATVASYVVTSKIAKKIENEYNSVVSLVSLGGIEAGDIKCSGGMSVNCSIDKITMSSYRETNTIKDIKINLKGSKARAKIAFGFTYNVETKADKDSYYSRKDLSYLNNTHVSCEYEGRLMTEKSLLKSDLLCQVKDADKNIYTYNLNTNNIGEIFKDTDFMKLTSSEDKFALLEGVDGIETYLNSLEIKTKIANENNLIDKYVKALAGDDFNEKFIEELKNIEKHEDYKKATEEEKKLLQLAQEFFINNHKNITIKADAIEENKVKFRSGDFLGIKYVSRKLISNENEGIKLTTSAK